MGPAACGALGVILVNSVVNSKLFKSLAAHNKAFLSARNHRLELVTEMLRGSRIVKMLSSIDATPRRSPSPRSFEPRPTSRRDPSGPPPYRDDGAAMHAAARLGERGGAHQS